MIGSVNWTAVAVVLVTLVSPQTSRADASVACYLGMLIESRAILSHCGDVVSEADEARYGQLKVQLDTFIRQYRRPPGINYLFDEAEIRNHLKSKDARMICGDETHSSARSTFYELVSPSKTHTFRELLQQPKDPWEGDCL